MRCSCIVRKAHTSQTAEKSLHISLTEAGATEWNSAIYAVVQDQSSGQLRCHQKETSGTQSDWNFCRPWSNESDLFLIVDRAGTLDLVGPNAIKKSKVDQANT